MRMLVLGLTVLASTATFGHADTFTIHPDGSGDFPTIQAAIEAAADGDVIELTDGTFTDDGNRDLDYLGKAITLRSQSGNPDACIISCGPPHTIHRGIHFHNGEGPGSIIQNLTIVGGRCDEEYPWNRGGAILCEGASPVLEGCVFRVNSASFGGVLHCSEEASPALRDCFIDGNAGDWGAAIHCTEQSSVDLTDCEFRTQFCLFGGGVVMCEDASSVTATNCLFHLNGVKMPAPGGGAILCLDGSSATLTGCVFHGNNADVGGAASIQSSEATFDGCTFFDNESVRGGGIYLYQSTAQIVGCTFYGNWSSGAGGVYCGPYASPLIENTIIAFNERGPAIVCEDGTSHPLLVCCDVYGNAGGDWIGCIADQFGVDGNICDDPLFCAPAEDDFTLDDCSPCAPQEPCGLIGAWPVGCGMTPVTPVSWGEIKSRFRARGGN